MTDDPEHQADGLQRFWGGLLVAVGALIAATCGGCTALVFVAGIPMFLETAKRGDFSMLATLPVLLIGVVPTLIGVVMFRAGVKRLRAPKPPATGTIE